MNIDTTKIEALGAAADALAPAKATADTANAALATAETAFASALSAIAADFGYSVTVAPAAIA